jgi:hypothetical protein
MHPPSRKRRPWLFRPRSRTYERPRRTMGNPLSRSLSKRKHLLNKRNMSLPRLHLRNQVGSSKNPRRTNCKNLRLGKTSYGITAVQRLEESAMANTVITSPQTVKARLITSMLAKTSASKKRVQTRTENSNWQKPTK